MKDGLIGSEYVSMFILVTSASRKSRGGVVTKA